MNRRLLIVMALAATAVATSGERLLAEPFPLKQQYVAVAFNGKPFDDRSRTLQLGQDPKLGYVISAHAGCNYVSAVVAFAEGDRMAFKRWRTTARYCKTKMVSEGVYFDALRRMNRWRIESEKLILAGGKDVLEFVQR